jgi:glycerophosphoryl diester phosphodiesterase
MTLAELQRLDAGYRFTPDGGRTFPFRGTGVRVPTLRELLRAFPGVRMNVDLKGASRALESAFADVLRGERALDRICCGSELDAVGERLHALLPEACHFYPHHAAAGFILSVRAGEPPPVDGRFQVLDIPAEFEGTWIIDDALVDTAARLGKWINVWTIDTVPVMRRLISQRVGGIMTDRPDLLRAVLDGRPLS